MVYGKSTIGIMKEITAVIIEDEVPAARLLLGMVKEVRPDWDVQIVSGSLAQLTEWFGRHRHPDLLFLDIELADCTSFDLIEKVKPRSSIIFTTAYNEYALRAFRVNSVDYLLKPIDGRCLREAIVKFESTGRNLPLPEDYMDALVESYRNREKRYRTRFLIPMTTKYVTLQVADVAYFGAEDGSTVATTYQGERFVINMSLTKLEEQLSPDLFFRINRRILVCVNAIMKIEPYFNGRMVVVLKPKTAEAVTVSEERISSFKLWLNY